MKGIIFFLLSFLLFFQSFVNCADWSTSKKVSDTSFVITKEIEKTDTLYEKNGVVSIVFTKTIIPTDTVFFRGDVGYYNAYLFYDWYNTGKCDSSELFSRDRAIYGSGFKTFLKTEKHYSKYIYFDVNKKTIYSKKFYSEKTVLSRGKLMIAFVFVVFSFFGSFFLKAYKKREDERISNVGGKDKKFWLYVSCIFCLLLFVLILFGVILGVDEMAYFVSISLSTMFFCLPIATHLIDDDVVLLISIIIYVLAIAAFTNVTIVPAPSMSIILSFLVTSAVIVLCKILGLAIKTPEFLLK